MKRFRPIAYGFMSGAMTVLCAYQILEVNQGIAVANGLLAVWLLWCAIDYAGES